MDTSKIIIGTVGGGRYTVTAPIVKEDYGLYLKIEGLELPSTYEVDFSNSEHNGTSITMIGNTDGVLIPHQFIDSGKDIFAFLYHVGVDFGRTVYKFRIPNKLRPDRTNETPTPEEQSTIDQAISALNSAVSATAQDVIDADASAQSASQSAESAHDSAVDAQNYAESASGYASDAQGYATTASQKATEADNSADRAAQIKTDIEGYVSTAQTAAQTATDKAAQASQSATNASNSATTASTKAGEASASATTASNKASEASGYASTASQKATEASQSASQALTYKNDAESAKTASQTAQGKAEDAQTAAETAQGKAEDAQEAAESAAASVSASAAQIATNTADILKAFPTDSASGAIASFSDGADGIPLKSLVVNIDPVQDLSNGDPSPENICPISGWTGMQLNANGTVIPISWQTEAGTVYGGKLDVLSGKLTIDMAMVDLGTLDWKYYQNGIFYTTALGRVAKIYGACVSDIYVNNPFPVTAPINGYMFIAANGNKSVFRAVNTAYSDKMTFKTAMSGHQLVYELVTPIEIQLTPNQVNSLLGVNNIWADTGDVSVEYRADTKLYISRLTEPDADMIADSNITSGQYFMVGNSLYKATANIASGASVIVGTNAIRKSLSEALNEINA